MLSLVVNFEVFTFSENARLLSPRRGVGKTAGFSFNLKLVEAEDRLFEGFLE